MNATLTAEQVRRMRLRAQGVTRDPGTHFASPAAVLRAVGGVQAQDLPSALLAVRARSRGLTAEGVTSALREQRSILHCWCMRGTLHLVDVEDARWLIPLLGPALIAGDRRRMAQLGWDDKSAARGLDLLEAAVEKTGGLTRPEIARLLKDHALPCTGQAPLHLLYRAVLEGRLCSGPLRGAQPVFVPFVRWAGPLRPLPREAALAELARRFLAGYGPAAPADLANWSGIKIGEARSALQAIEAETTRVDGPDGLLWLPASRVSWLEEDPPPIPQVRLLPRFDNLLVAYQGRGWLVPPEFEYRIFPGGGILAAVLLIGDRAAGTWKWVRQRKISRVVIEPFAALDPALEPGLAEEVEGLARFLNTPITFLI